MVLEALSTNAVREDLRALRYHKPLSGSPLMGSALVAARLAREGAHDTPAAREWAVGEVLREAVEVELAELRAGREVAGTASDWGVARGVAAELDHLRRDFQGNRKELEAWALVAHYYLSVEPLQLQELAHALGMVEKTMQRRLARGHELVAAALRAREVMAQARQAQDARSAREAPPAERVRAVGAPRGGGARSDTAPPSDSTRSAAPSDAAVPPPGILPTTAEATAALLEAIRGDRAVHLREDALREIGRQTALTIDGYRLGRFATWALPRHALDRRFVALTLLVDQGEQASERWAAKGERFEDLRALLAAAPDTAIVVLGAPGSGKSTLLRRLEMDLAAEGLRGQSDTLTFFARLGGYRAGPAGGEPPSPLEWLAAEWSTRCPRLPPLPDLMSARSVLLLLDGVNEMPHDGPRVYHERVGAWRAFLQAMAAQYPRARAVLSCRSLDYSAPLSSAALRVPQVQVEPLTDEQIREFLDVHGVGAAARRDDGDGRAAGASGGAALWARLEGTRQLDVLRVPYFLRLLVDQAEGGDPPVGQAALFTGFVRQGLRRELERGNPLFLPDGLLTDRDCSRVTSATHWRTSWELPERGKLVPKLAHLAFGMQSAHRAAAGAQARLAFDEALALLDDRQDEEIVRAGTAITVLDDDRDRDEVGFFHQLLQEYFAARELARAPNPELVRRPWREADIRPSVGELIATLPPGETLPPLPQTGWEETTLLAASMAGDAEAFVGAVAEANLALAGRCADQPEVRRRLGAAFLDDLRWSLVHRSRDPEADLRDRIACGLAVGDLGDPRFERRVGSYGEYLMPPLVEIPGGVYPIGEDEAIEWAQSSGEPLQTDTDHIPRHEVAIMRYHIGRFPVTNAEWRCFIDARGYEDERWWDTEDARRWLRGEIANEAGRVDNRAWRHRFLENPLLFEQMVDEGRFPNEEAIKRWRNWIYMSDAEFETALDVRWQAKRETRPAYWRDVRFDAAAQPVVGVCWYEARAFCNWLSVQTGMTFRLPTEVEWEAAVRGSRGRLYPFGDVADPMVCNTQAIRLRQTTPIGVFHAGDTPDGVSDLAGNVYEWTLSLWGTYIGGNSHETPKFLYPYDPDDGREAVSAGQDQARVVRGGSWLFGPIVARAALRIGLPPSSRVNGFGFRLVVDNPDS